MKYLTIAAMLIVTAMLISCGTIIKVKDKYYKAAHNAGLATDFSPQGSTNLGIRITGNRDLKDEWKALVDSGFTEVIAQAKEEYGSEIEDKAYTPQFYEYTIPRLTCDLSPEQRVPSFLTYGGYQYDGTIYDQYNPEGKLPAPQDIYDNNGVFVKTIVYKMDGYSAIYAAESVINFGTTGSNIDHAVIYVCDSNELKNAFRYGVEHCLLANGKTDRVLNWFWATAYHGSRSHPLIPRGDSLVEPTAPQSLLAVAKNKTEYTVVDNVMFSKNQLIVATK